MKNKIKILTALIVFSFVYFPLLFANVSGQAGADVQACVQRASYLSNPADRTAVCECIHKIRSEQECEQWKGEIQRLLTGNYQSPPAPVPALPDPHAECVRRAAASISNPADRLTVCQCLAGEKPASGQPCSQFQAQMDLLLYGRPQTPPSAPNPIFQQVNAKQIDPAALAKLQEKPVIAQKMDPPRAEYETLGRWSTCNDGYYCARRGFDFFCVLGDAGAGGASKRCEYVDTICENYARAKREGSLQPGDQSHINKYCGGNV